MKSKFQHALKLLSLILLVQLVELTSCSKKTDCCIIIDTEVQIYYKNTDGADLINSSNDFDQKNIRLYYKNGDHYEYAYNGNLDLPNMYAVDKAEDGKEVLSIFPSNHYEGNFSTTLIELNKNMVDTLLCEFELHSNSVICKNAWLNGLPMQNRFIEMVK